jgi:hypothetical protein
MAVDDFRFWVNSIVGRLNFLTYQDRNGPKADLISTVLDARRNPGCAYAGRPQ